MHNIEPFYNWQHLYLAEEDELSPYFGTVHSEFEFSQTIYNYYIHPQWDEFGSSTLYLKIIFADYETNSCIIELIGEWNDALQNDSMLLKRNLIDLLIAKKIFKYVLICENILNFFADDASYYEEWHEDICDSNGWICFLNITTVMQEEINLSQIPSYVSIHELDNWRTMKPEDLIEIIESEIA